MSEKTLYWFGLEMICVYMIMKYYLKLYAKQIKYCRYLFLILSTLKQAQLGALKTGSFRARFLLTISCRFAGKPCRHLVPNLLIRIGDPAEVLTELAEQYHINEVYHHREVAPDETGISEKVEAALWKIKLNLKHFIGHTMYHKEDLPFPIKDIPDSFVTFKKKVERDSTVRPSVLLVLIILPYPKLPMQVNCQHWQIWACPSLLMTSAL
jgi:deoxyribodipyrimidine photolyase